MPLVDIADWIDSVEGRSRRQHEATAAGLAPAAIGFARNDSAIFVGDWQGALDVTLVDHTVPRDL